MKLKKLFKKVLALLLVVVLVAQGSFNISASEPEAEPQATETTVEATTQAKEEEVPATTEEPEKEEEPVATEKKEEPTTEAATTEAEPKQEEVTTENKEEKTTAAKKEETAVSKDTEEEESTTEAEEEKPKTRFSYRDSRVTITAEAQEKANLPQDAVLKAKYLTPGSAEYKTAVAKIDAKYGSDDANVMADYVLYDIYFQADGKEIEPESGAVSVKMSFNKPILGDVDGKVISREVIHIPDGGTPEKVTDYVNTTSEGAVSSVGFTTDSFSEVGIMLLTEGAEPTDYDMTKFIKSVTITVTIDGTDYKLPGELPSGVTVPKDAPVDVKITYDPTGVKFKTNDTISYTIPEGIKPDSEETGSVTAGPETVGTYKITTDGKITITLTNEEYLAKSDGALTNGSVSFSGHFQSDSWGQGGDKDIAFGETTITIPFTPDPIVTKAVVNITKTDVGDTIKYYEDTDTGESYYYIEYKIKVSTPSDNTEVVKNVNVEDVFTKGMEYVDSIIDVTVTEGTTFDQDSKKWTMGDMDKGQTKTLTFKAKLKDSIVSAGTDVSRSVVNKATVKSGTDTKNSATATTTATAGINITKTNSGYNKNNKTVTYTVTVKALNTNKWTLNNVTVQDVFGENKEYVTTYTSVICEKGNITNSYITADTPNGDKKLDWNIGSMAPGETRTLTYTVSIDDKVFLDGTGWEANRTLRNAAKVYVNGQQKNNANSSVNFRKVWIWKNGQLQSDGRVKFIIHANESTYHAPILNGTIKFTDSLRGDWVYDGNIIVRKYTYGPNPLGELIETDTSYNIDGKKNWTIEYNDGTGYFYELEYYARYTGEQIGKPSIGNGAGIVIGVGGSDYDHKTSWSGSGQEYDGLHKEFVSRDGNIATWTSKIICNIPAETVYTDWRDSNHEWSMTDDQIAGITVGGAAADAVKGTDYIVQRAGTGFTITFKKAFDATPQNPITITYNTTLETDDVAEGQTATYVNKAKIGINGHEDNAQADCTYTQEQRLLKTAGTYNEKTGQMTWDIKVNVTGSMAGDATVTDILPEGLEYVSAAITARGSKADGTAMSVDNATESNGRDKVTMNLTGLVASGDMDAYVTITLTTKVVDRNFLLSNGEKTFVNTATLEYMGSTKDSTAQITIRNTSLTKAGLYNKDTAPNIEYTVVVNPNGLDMLKNAESVKVQDTMGTGMMLLVSSLKVVGDKSGELDVTESLEVKDNVFSFDVPDNEKVTITYSAYVAGEIGDDVKVTNTVQYYGQSGVPPVKEEREIKIQESKATIEGLPAFFIAKKDGADKTTALAGAKYELYTVGSDGTLSDKPVQTGVSDDKGYVYFRELDENTVYAFRETEAPEGYYIDEENSRFTYVAFKNSAITEAMDNLGVLVIQKGYTFERFNYKGEITVKKTFAGEKADGKYYFGLFDESGNTLIKLRGANAVGAVTVANGLVTNDVIFKGVPFGTYTVYETDAAGNKLSVGSDGTVVANGTKYIVSGEGTAIEVSADDPKETTMITNTYKPLEITLTATKALKNKGASKLKTFRFNLIKDGRVIDVESNDDNGNIVFDKMTFTRDDVGIHTFTLKEEVPEGVNQDNPTKDGITYDLTEYEIEITVAHSDATGLTAEVKVDGVEIAGENGIYAIPKQQTGDGTASFVNVYDVCTSVQFEGTKTLANADLTEGKFKFTITGPNLKDEDGNPVESLTVSHDAEGMIQYPEIAYSLADLKNAETGTFAVSKDFIYTIAEGNGGKTIDGITYSDKSYTVVVTLTNTGTALSAVAKEGSSFTGKNFANTYSAKGTTTVSGTKSLDGASLAAEAYTFTLTETTEEAETPYSVSVNNNKEGNFTLPLPVYTHKDDGKTFTYTVSEQDDEKDGVTYDKTNYYVTIKVTDNQDGTLTLDKTIKDAENKDVDSVVFANTFRGSVVLTKTNGKTGDAQEVLSGAVFRLYKIESSSPNVRIGEYTTGTDGKIEVRDLKEGSYYFVETKAPAGYSIVKDGEGYPVHYNFVIGPNGGEEVVNATITVGNEQKLGTLKLKKTDTGQTEPKALQGAEFTLYQVNPDGDDISYQEGLTTNEEGVIAVSSLPWGEYYFVETKAADGYVLDATPTAKVTIDAAYVDGEVRTISKTNESTRYEFAKVDTETGKPVSGAQLQLTDKNNTVIDSWTTTEETHKIEAVLIVGETYTLTETTPPAGYAFAEPIEFTVGNTSELITVTMEDKQTEISITKTDITGEEEVPGAALEVRDGDTLIDSWTSTEEVHKIKGVLEVGKEYTIVETIAPTGYAYTKEIRFTVNNDGTITTTASTTKDEDGKDIGILVKDTKIHFNVDKVDIITSEEVAGALFTIYDKETGEKVTEWTSDGEKAHDFGNALTAGKTYILEETIAPDGYAYVSNSEFTVNEDGTIETELEVSGDSEGEIRYLVEDDITKITIMKVDDDGNAVEGAKLAVRDPETKEFVMEWTTDGNPKEINGQLIAGKTYDLVETEAPKGYLIAGDVEFTVPEEAKAIEVVMTDPKEEEQLGSISVIKKIVLRDIEGDYDLYANDATYYVGLFTDPDGKHPYGPDAIKEAHIVNGSASEAVVYDNLTTGTYYVLETTEDGTPIPLDDVQMEGKTYYVCEVSDEGGTNEVKIDTAAKELEGKVNLTNAYMELPEGYFYNAKMPITKSVLKNGEVMDTDDVFYAGIFTSETAAVPFKVIQLENNETVTIEVPLGGENGDEPIVYCVFETDENGNKLDKDAFSYEVSGEGTVTLDKENLSGNITITNSFITKDENSDESESEGDSESDSDGDNKSKKTEKKKKSTTSKTGDRTPVGVWLILCLGAATMSLYFGIRKLYFRGKHSR